MARLTAPLLSLGASGSIAKSLVFATWKGIPYARVHVIPANPQTVAQQEVRGVFACLSEMWKRMPPEARLPFQHAVRGLALTPRNQHIKENVAVLIDEPNLNELVMSVAGGNAIPPATCSAVDGTNGRIACAATLATPPPGYTISYVSGVAVLDGEPGETPILTCYANDDSAAPYAWDIICNQDEDFQVGIFCVYIRDADQRAFCSSATRFQVTVSGSP